MAKSRDEIWDDWRRLMNIPPAELDRWLQTRDSRRVGDTRGEGESTGHKSGRRIVDIRRTRKADLTEDDWAHMGKVVGYVHRHLAQGGPEQDKAHSDWRYSLMNWGHDPLR
ncbi:DUF3140 domain-containing protein [Frigidibacter oleivorans]|uniref:DUF3140 domain-containing protein n=1 Tax=Frigidibacter oleivorans TaxID=2487129 RepID=UPI000F8D1DFD|nr:DUF3140 domain-containing protein [Frigidibacter oleivorans]